MKVRANGIDIEVEDSGADGRQAGRFARPHHPTARVLLQQVVRKAFLGLAKPYLIKTTAGHLGIAHHHGMHVGAAQPGRSPATTEGQ